MFNYTYTYAPDTLLGEHRYHQLPAAFPPNAHTPIPRNHKDQYTQCSCGLIALTLVGNRGHRDPRTNETQRSVMVVLPAPTIDDNFDDGLDAWGMDENGEFPPYVPREPQPPKYNVFCSCGRVFGRALSRIPSVLQPHECDYMGMTDADHDNITLAQQNLYQEVHFDNGSIMVRIGIPDAIMPEFEIKTMPFEGEALFIPEVGLARNVKEIFSQMEEIDLKLVKTRSRNDAFDPRDHVWGIYAKSPRAIRVTGEKLMEVSKKFGCNGYRVYQNGIMMQVPVLTPEFSGAVRMHTTTVSNRVFDFN